MNAWPFTPELAAQIHARVVSATGGSAGIRDRGLLEAAEEAIVGLATGSLDLDAFTGWVLKHTTVVK